VKLNFASQVVGEEDCHEIVFENVQCASEAARSRIGQLVKLPVGAKSGQAIFSKRSGNRFGRLAKLLANLAL